MPTTRRCRPMRCRHFRDALIEAEQFGLEALKQAQIDLGRQVRDLMQRYRYKSVAAEGFEAPSVVVCFAPNAEMKSGKAFAEQGFRSPPAYRWNAASAPTTPRSGSAFSGWTSLAIRSAPSRIWKPRWNRFAGRTTLPKPERMPF